MAAPVLHTTLAEMWSWGQTREEGGKTLLTDDNQKCPGDGDASF